MSQTVRPSSVFDAKRTPFHVITEDGIDLIGEVAAPLIDDAVAGTNEAYTNSLNNLTGTFDFGLNNPDVESSATSGITFGGKEVSGTAANIPTGSQLTDVQLEGINTLDHLSGVLVNEGIKVNTGNLGTLSRNTVSVKIKFDQK